MKKSPLLLAITLLACISCNQDDEGMAFGDSLADYLQVNSFEEAAVIACAASTKTAEEILVFYYPEPGAGNPHLYISSAIEGNAAQWASYTQSITTERPFFNAYLKAFVLDPSNEQSAIVTYELDGEVKVSNPIRLKNSQKLTVWTQEVAIDQSQTLMPQFTWEDNSEGDNAIYFQVLTDADNNLISGTYTHQNQFQFYNLNNVVLNITRQEPTSLEAGKTYGFTLMDVSLDNWVNKVIESEFIAQ